MVQIGWVLVSCLLCCVAAGPLEDVIQDRRQHPTIKYDHRKTKHNSEENNPIYWQNLGKERVKKMIQNELNLNKAKNVILFLGDGMSISTVTASRMYMGQLNGQSGEEAELSFEKFPSAGLSKTYCLDAQVGDSACTATAYLSGIKGNDGTIGVSGHVPRFSCEKMQNTSYHVDSLAKRFMDDGRNAGIVTTTRVTHASPAGAYVHTAERNWESDSDILAEGHDPTQCTDIAHQLVHGETGKNLKVILGGGRREFRSIDTIDEEGTNGRRSDNRDLIKEWQQLKSVENKKFEYVWNKEGLMNVREDTDYLLGLFEGDHCRYNLETTPEDPSFEDMVEAAIKKLSKDDKGFFLFAEGGRIDHAHHDGFARLAVDETVEFSKGIAKAVSMTNEEDTLIIVTSDHSHGLTLSGYANRGHSVLDSAGSGDDRIPYMTLSYANGPGYRKEIGGERIDVTLEDIENPRFRFPALVPFDSDTHAGEDVGVFAHGPWNHLFTGVYEQSSIPHLVTYAACLDDELSAC